MIYCATSAVQLTGDIDKVDNVGVTHISRCWIDAKHASASKAKTETKAVKRMVANFSKEAAQDEWDLMHVGPLVKEVGYGGQDFANALIAEDQNRLCFQGTPSRTPHCCTMQTRRTVVVGIPGIPPVAFN